MLVKGLPERFWLVMKPSMVSVFADICAPCDFIGFAKQIRGGLDEHSIKGIFAEEADAVALAKELLERMEVFRQQPGVRIHPSPWPSWCATQYSPRGILLCNRETKEEVFVEPPHEWGRHWAWNFTEDGTGIVMRRTP